MARDSHSVPGQLSRPRVTVRLSRYLAEFWLIEPEIAFADLSDNPSIRIPGRIGRRPAVGARALSDREIREKAGHRDELPKAIKAFYMRAGSQFEL